MSDEEINISLFSRIKYKFGVEHSFISNKLDVDISYNIVLLKKETSENISNFNDGDRSGIEIKFKYNIDY